jgi:hypothetical protein
MATILRIWSSEDGESHLEDHDVVFAKVDYLPPAPPMLITAPSPASGYSSARVPPEVDLDWHPAETRQLAIYLSGEGEIEASDGTVRAFGPGTIVLAEDTTGKGHKSRVTGSEEMLVVIVSLPNDTTRT